MKGVILAAGKGTRLFPISKVIPKCLLPVYDRPMIYYSIDVIKKFGVSEVAIVISSDAGNLFQKLLGDGTEFGIKITYIVQENQQGNAISFKSAKDFVGDDDVVLMFGDNIFIGDLAYSINESLYNLKNGYATLMAYTVTKPEDYGVIETDKSGNVISLEEKPTVPKSNQVMTGLFVYDNSVFEKLDLIKLSERGEYEMTDVNKIYIENNRLKAIKFEPDFCKWYDAGNIDELFRVSAEIKKNKDFLMKRNKGV